MTNDQITNELSLEIGSMSIQDFILEHMDVVKHIIEMPYNKHMESTLIGRMHDVSSVADSVIREDKDFPKFNSSYCDVTYNFVVNYLEAKYNMVSNKLDSKYELKKVYGSSTPEGFVGKVLDMETEKKYLGSLIDIMREAFYDVLDWKMDQL